MSRKIKIAFLVLILILVVGGSVTIAAFSVYKPNVVRNYFNKPYSIIYLDSGEIYVGKLSNFPRLTLTDAYLMQIVTNPDDATQTSFQLAPLSDTLWSPKEIHLNKDHIIFSAHVRDDSQVAQTLKNK